METKSSKEKKISLAEKINNLIIAAPTNFGSDDEDEETKAQVVDKYEEASSDEDVGLSLLRKQNVSLLENVDERYKGKKISRKDIYENDKNVPFQNNVSDNNEEIESNYNSMEEDSIEDSEVNDSDENDDNEATDEDNDEENDQSNSEGDYSDDSIDSQQVDGDDDKNFKNIIPSNEGEIEKGQCVHHQLKIWDNLLEMRIKLQKCLITSNKLPQYTTHNDFMTDEECLKRKNETKNSLMKLLDKMLNIQDKLLNNYPETKGLLSTKKSNTEEEHNNDDDDDDDDPMNEEIDSDTEEEMKNDSDEPPKKKQKVKSLSEYEKILDENHKKYSSYRNSVIQKWNDKTRIASGKINKGGNQSVVKQIEFLLNDKSKLVQKTQLKRSEYEIIGKESTNETDEDGRRVQEYDPEIYDDNDFYQQLLSGLIEQKVADITDPIQLSKQWVQLQNMRSKMKRKIDTKATKGRRIRYNVHPKLINFMAPITINDTWSDEAKTELYNSLFGKIKVVENN